jgi:hypothetical protein
LKSKARKLSKVVESWRSLPEIRAPRAAITLAIPLIPDPPIPTKWIDILEILVAQLVVIEILVFFSFESIHLPAGQFPPQR